MLNIGKMTDVSSIKIEALDCNATREFATEQLNWQLAQSSPSKVGIKIEQEHPDVVWQSSEAMANWQAPREQLDTGSEETEYISEYDMDPHDSVRKRKFTPMQRLGKRSAENVSAKRKKQMKLPEIFRFFGNIERVQESSAKPGAISATCNACHSRIKGFVTVTSNFIKHLRLKHTEIHAAFIGAKQSGITEPPEAQETESFDHRVMCYIIDTASPLSIVETDSFRNLFKGTNLRLVSRSKLEMRLDARFAQIVNSIKNVIATKKYVCTSADIWPTRDCSYFGYTCHWLDHKYQRNSVALACKRFSGDYAQILEVISSINNDYELNNLKIVATVTHNFSDFSRAFQEFGINSKDIKNEYVHEYESDCEANANSIELTCNVLPNHIRCASHTLNVLASTDFVHLLSMDRALKERHTRIFAKCSSLWRKCDCSKSAETIAAVLGEALIIPTITRWNSIYDAICCILSHKEKLAELCSKLSLHNSCFSASDIQYLEEYRILMCPIASTIEFLRMDNNLFYGCLIPALTSLCVKLKRVSDSSELIDLKIVALELQLKLKERFAKYLRLAEDANNAIIASVLCPSVKMRWFNALAKVSSQDRSADDIHKIVIAEAVRHAKATENAYQSAMESAYPKEKDDFYEFDETDDGCETSDLDMSQPSPLPAATKLMDDVEAQFHSYLRDTGTTFEILEKYPLLHDLALKYNTPLTSSAPVERVLSLVHINRYLRRSDPADYPIEKLVLLKANGSF
ncbi:uncharacterized protein pre-mod(mdg4)-E [Drosophila montana]|uniref:uncharacterized protein pre-mod(mdg4)-E n=1 Tax=Drosophila montana TaxID=40370 RepID=UPI00313B7DB1